jgi:hypothetical protein
LKLNFNSEREDIQGNNMAGVVLTAVTTNVPLWICWPDSRKIFSTRISIEIPAVAPHLFGNQV